MTVEQILLEAGYDLLVNNWEQAKDKLDYFALEKIIKIAIEQGYGEGFQHASKIAIEEINKNYTPNK